MAIYVTCRNCNQPIYLEVTNASELPPRFTARCYRCASQESYYRTEAREERWDFRCVVCSGRFFTRQMPPRQVTCPHCSSVLYLDAVGNQQVLNSGQVPMPPPGSRPVAGAIGGALLGGSIGGPLGALIGLLAGVALGSSAENREARDV